MSELAAYTLAALMALAVLIAAAVLGFALDGPPCDPRAAVTAELRP